MLVAREQKRGEATARRKKVGRRSIVSNVLDVAWLWRMSPRFIKPETMRLTGETPLENLPRKTRSYLALVRERSLILPGICKAILGQGQDIHVHVIWFCQHRFCGTQVLQEEARGVIR
jgi:hypothetical protein